MPCWPSWNEPRNKSIDQMPAKKHQLGQPESRRDLHEVLGEELRGWIERVIVPILVVQYLHEKGLKEEKIDG